MVTAGLDRLYDFQHADGGWGWWKMGDSDHFMTAYVVWGLVMAKEAGVTVRENVLDRGVEYLEKELVEENRDPDMQAWMLHALGVDHASRHRDSVGKFPAAGFENLWKNRDRLNAFTRALLALSAHHFKYNQQAKILIQNLENGVKIDTSPDTSVLLARSRPSDKTVIGTAHWGEDGIYWRWSDGPVEATAFALKALLAVDPGNKLVEPVTNWLIKNRRGSQWNNTRDTAITILALNEYLRKSGELAPEMEYELFVNGRSAGKKKLSAQEALDAPSEFGIDPEWIKDGANEIRIIRKKGHTPLYFAVQAEFFSLEEPIPPAGNEIFVQRRYYKLVGKPTLLKGLVYDREPLPDKGSVAGGERVQVVLTLEAKNDYDYLLFEDLKPAGLEAVEIRSGETLYAKELKSHTVEQDLTAGNKKAGAGTREERDYTGRSRWVYQELRDRKVALFIDHLPQGIWEIRYDLRAEVPGQFHALPVLGGAMYVPEIRCNGEELRLKVTEK